MLRRLAACSVAVPVLAVCAAGCSNAIGRQEIEQKLAQGYHDKTGHTARSVTCPDDLSRRSGSSERCTVVDTDGHTTTYSVTVTHVRGDRYEAHYQPVS